MAQFYVYLLMDHATPFYVGMGTGERYLSHARYARGETSLGYGLKKDPNPYKTRKIKKILREGRQIQHEFWYCDSEIGAHCLEKFLIAHYGRKGIDKAGILTNRHPGGVGGNTFDARSGRSKTALRKKHAMAQQRVYAERGAQIKAKIRSTKEKNGTWGVVSDETRLKISKANRIRCASQRIAIEQYSADGELLASWASMREAALTLGIHQGPISNALDQLRKDGTPKLAAGYIWKRSVTAP